MTPTSTEAAVVEIIVAGLPATGKTTLIRTISQESGFDFEQDAEGWSTTSLSFDNALKVMFVEPPASRSFDFLWMRDLISSVDVPGYIVVFDSSTPELFGEAISVLQTIRAFHHDTPIVVAANKQDDPYAWSAEDIRIGLCIPSDIQVLPCVAKDPAQVREIVLQLLYRIFDA